MSTQPIAMCCGNCDRGCPQLFADLLAQAKTGALDEVGLVAR